MKHKVTKIETVKKKGILGIPYTKTEKRTVWVDGKTFRKMKQQQKHRPFTMDELIMYDCILEEDES